MRVSNRQTGFTLIELITALCIVCILVGSIVPALSNTIDNTKRKNAVYKMMAVLNFARNAAVDNSRSVVICPTHDNTTCLKNKDWSHQVLIFVDKNQNGQRENEEQILRRVETIGEKHSLTWRSFGNKSWLSFDENGTAGFQSGRFYFCKKNSSELRNRAQIIIYRTGRARIATQQEFKKGC